MRAKRPGSPSDAFTPSLNTTPLQNGPISATFGGTLFGRKFWARGYCVSTVGLDERMIREYVRNQEKHDREEDGQQQFDFE